MMQLRKADHVVTNPDRRPRNDEERDKQIVGYVLDTMRAYKDARQGLEEIWQESWAAYFGTPYAQVQLAAHQLITVGNVNVEWRHRINLGKAFSSAEDIHGQLMQAAFPTTEPFDVQPLEPSLWQVVRLLKKYYSEKLHTWQFKSHFANYLRQAIVLGSSCIALPWHSKDYIAFETLDMFDVFVDPTCDSAETSPLIRRVFYTKAQLITMAERGEIDIAPMDVVQYEGDDLHYDDNKDRVMQYQGLQLLRGYCPFDKVPVYEFWGDIHLTGETYFNRVAKVLGQKLIKFAENPYDCGRPFVFGTYIPVVRQPYGIGAIQSSLGMIHTMNIVTNQRLDNTEIELSKMFTVKAGSITRAEDVTSTPGKTYEVDEHDDIRPIDMGASNAQLGFAEVNEIEKYVDKNTGAGPLVGSGQPRGGERVTAEEIKAIQNAGGSRLVAQWSHIETTSLEPIVEKTMSNIVQFVETDDVISVPRGQGLGNEYYQVGPTELRGLKHRVRARTAGYLVQRQEIVDRIIQFTQLVLSVPQFVEKINYDKLLYDLLMHWGFEDPEGYLITEENGAPMTMESQLSKMGGQPLVQGISEQLAADGGRDFFRRMTNQELPEGVQINDILANLAASSAELRAEPNKLTNVGAPSNQ